ncbi:MAG: hypothetical protein ACI81A_001201, partial [Paraglaciecola sp.]
NMLTFYFAGVQRTYFKLVFLVRHVVHGHGSYALDFQVLCLLTLA